MVSPTAILKTGLNLFCYFFNSCFTKHDLLQVNVVAKKSTSVWSRSLIQQISILVWTGLKDCYGENLVAREERSQMLAPRLVYIVGCQGVDS